jgi:hypothetical protein
LLKAKFMLSKVEFHKYSCNFSLVTGNYYQATLNFLSHIFPTSSYLYFLIVFFFNQQNNIIMRLLFFILRMPDLSITSMHPIHARCGGRQ